MKVYYHKNAIDGSNTYIVLNTHTKEALIIDPGKITQKMIEHIEKDNYVLDAILITHGRESSTEGITTLDKIYKSNIYAADSGLISSNTIVLKGDGVFTAASMKISYFAVAGHSPDSMAYKLGDVIFTGDALIAGSIGKTTNPYAKKLLITNIQTKLLPHKDSTVIFPCHGPLSTIGSEKKFNMELGCPLLHIPLAIKK